ncbi:UDP-galactose transporter [Leishmania panamensis]|uniref:UDP-galactose transporter n=1 Tax=Leishmania panamensis TaxID=5679 RepID=A0A088RN30_LEIPA|nr:UDP-galactose transporter [Leishmania panamensis]AIN97220.1 UDP-galactose transporter [Leishmania panamensis]
MALICGISSMAMISLIVLVVQNSLLVVMTRFSRANVDAVHNYHTSTLVMNQEILKMIVCLVIYGLDDVYKTHQHDVASTDRISNTAHQVVGFEVCVPVTRGGRVRNVEHSASQSEGIEALSYLGKETSDAHISSAMLLEAMAVGDAAVESACHVAGDLGTSHNASRVVKMTSAYGRRTAFCGAAWFVSQVRRLLQSTSLAQPRHSSALAGTRACVSDKWRSSADALSALRSHGFCVLYRRLHALCSLYCSMLSTSVCKRDTLKLLLPSFLFTMQNFLIFIGLSNLDAVSFQVWSQTKLLSTAIFSVWLLDRKLSLMQWLSLVVLTAGVLVAQLGASAAGIGMRPTDAPHAPYSTKAPDLSGAKELHADKSNEPSSNALIGITACTLSGLSSSYAGVYFEKVVKTTSPTLSMRNIQLSLFGIPLAFASMMILGVFPNWYASAQCGQRVHWNIFSTPVMGISAIGGTKAHCPVRSFYFWQRYDEPLTWVLVSIHALGGLLVAVVVKYADNILKGFANGIAVIISGMMSSALEGYEPSLAFVLGSALVIGSSIAFHKFEPKG